MGGIKMIEVLWTLQEAPYRKGARGNIEFRPLPTIVT